MSDQLQTIVNLKTKAKNRRDRRRYRIAVSILEKAITLAKEGLTSTQTTAARKSEFAEQLSDCYGMQGGIYRRRSLEAAERLRESNEQERAEQEPSDLVKSIEAYDEGFSYESHEDYGIVNSYNLVNRLVSRILYDPTWLSNEFPQMLPPPKDDGPLNMKDELEHAKEVLGKQLKLARRGDIWAFADQALVTLLLGEDDPVSAYAEFIAASPPDYAYVSAISALEPLAETLSKISKTENVSKNLKEALQQLEACLEEMKRKALVPPP